MAIDYAALKTELSTDPLSLGYKSYWDGGNDNDLVVLLNQVRNTINIDRDTVPAQEKTRVQTILSMGTVNIKGNNTRAALGAAFGAGTTTRTNLLAIQKRNGSRAEQLFGAGAAVTSDDISKARQS